MDDIIREGKTVIEILNRFSDDIITLGEPINDNRIEAFEQQISFVLPIDFKFIIKTYNGISLMGVEVLGIAEQLRGSSLDAVYKFEHFEVLSNPMPDCFVPFSPDGRGNYYCFNLKKLQDGLCPVVFWQHDYKYNDISEVEESHSNFIEWINEVMIFWTLEDYNYDGTEK